MERKYAIAIVLLLIGLLAGIFMLVRQNGGVAAVAANLLQAVSGQGGQWVQIQPRTAIAKDGVVGLSDGAVGTAVNENSVSVPAVAIKKPVVTWCDPANAGPVSAGTVIIGEVAWMGTSVSYSDEWIELENRSSASVDLSGWQLQNKNKKIKISFGSGNIIAAQGIYLLERTGDDTVGGIPANKIYTGGLANSNEALYLFDGNCNLVDTVVAAPDWPAGDNNTKQTMVRLPSLNWASSVVSGGTPGIK